MYCRPLGLHGVLALEGVAKGPVFSFLRHLVSWAKNSERPFSDKLIGFGLLDNDSCVVLVPP
jgi:hypothetical protein